MLSFSPFLVVMSYGRVTEDVLDIFNKPARLLVSGFSGSGKSTFVCKLIEKYRNKFQRVIVLGSELDISKELNIEFNSDFNPFQEFLRGSTLLIFDDIIYNKKLLTLAGEVFIRGRHLNISSILVTQNIFLSDKNFRQISLNTTHIILFKHRDEKQIICFSRSFLSDEKVKEFHSLYKKVVAKQKHQYLLIDFTVDIDSAVAIRSNVLGDGYERAFLL